MDVTIKTTGPASQFAGSNPAAPKPRAEGAERPASDAVVDRPRDTSSSSSTVTETGATRPVQSATGAAAAEPSTAQLNAAADEIQSFVDQISRELQFVVDQDSDRTIVKVLDGDGEVVRQIPSEEVIALAQALRETFNEDGGGSAAGLLLRAVS
jgi:flagellar protein FlaG